MNTLRVYGINKIMPKVRLLSTITEAVFHKNTFMKTPTLLNVCEDILHKKNLTNVYLILFSNTSNYLESWYYKPNPWN